MATLILKVSDKLFLRDPQDTELGRKIIEFSIELIEEMGFEQFTFKKLAKRIASTEASIYRYFENKHRLLVYLVSWYWTWVDYLIDYQTHNLSDPAQKLRIALRVLMESRRNDPASIHVDEELLHRIVIAESPKLYLTKQVDAIGKEGAFKAYETLCQRIADLVEAYAPGYPYALSLVSTLVGAVHEQLFFSEHLPNLTAVRADPDNPKELLQYLEGLTFSVLDKFAGK
ncbi:TetR/AcrR family transcriptional regulator [Catalinimonas alkaloidigena]|uniref:TetR/AcrR family transcriptional regulator n=1 Tax=Catalinimonas alkaloidigena TaxID=1075417 RepID=UPI000B7F7892|nr:TetR/AcrR family transcriptional regulator [Catalinimonas alkaloidigena]